MQEQYTEAINWLEQYPSIYILVSVCALLLAAWIGNWIVKRVLLRGLQTALKSLPVWRNQKGKEVPHLSVVSRLANIVPAVILSYGIALIPDMPETLVTIVRNVCSAFIVLTIALAISAALSLVNTLYDRRPGAHLKPIKGYIQVIKIVIFALATILMIAALIDRSPLILLSGLGAMAAVLMLVFQDTLLSLVASVQISSSDIIRVGDWIEMPQQNADGDVIDIALHTVRIQNFDNTITSVPTKRFISDSFKNWRGMSESGGRRIKRSLVIDQQSIRFLDEEEQNRMHRFGLLDGYLEEKNKELTEWNGNLADMDPVNRRRITNIGTLRAYIDHYLRNHPGIHKGMTIMVRQLDPTADGLPLELYCFTNTTAWVAYEGIQSDIFDHLLAILPEFGLRAFQHPSGRDMTAWMDNLSLKQEQANRPAE